MMQPIPAEDALRIARLFFAEAYEGPSEQWSWFTNTDRNSGIFGTIEPLTAEQASRTVTEGGRSIAAHIEHLRWSLANVNETLRGKPWQPDWSASWSVSAVDDANWDALQVGLRSEFDRVLEALDDLRDVPEPMMLTGLFALAPHAAHHLGTIRQMAKML